MNSSADEQYIEILNSRVKELQEKISKIQSKSKHGIDPFNNNAIKIKGYEIEIKELETEIKNKTPRAKLSDGVEDILYDLDDKYNEKDKKQNEIEQQIADLKDMRDKLKTVRARKKVDRKIEKLEAKVTVLKKKKVSYGKRQRAIMYPKYKKDMIKKSLLARAKGRVENYNDLIQDNAELKNMLRDDSIIDAVKGVIYDIKGAYYQKKLARADEILQEMQSKNSIITMAGARVTSLSKRYADIIRQKRQQQHQQQQPVVTM